MKRVNVVITDLDDTIWDWQKMWYNSFFPYFTRISNEFNIPQKELKDDFKRLHQKYGSTEFSFVYGELDTLTDENKSKVDAEQTIGKSILHEYYHLKKNNLNLCPGVYETLKLLKEKGVLIIGFTESFAFFTKYRLKHLELDGLMDCIYTPIDMNLPNSVKQVYPNSFWEPDLTEIRYLSSEVKKPAPEILEIIIKDFGLVKDQVIYIGDKLDKDVFMANQASIDSVHANYGHNIDSSNYDLLRDVTHWTEVEVQREKDFKAKNKSTPIAKHVLEKSFGEITNLYEFSDYSRKMNSEKAKNIINIWKKTIDVQQHFNDIELRIRNIALTTFTFIIGGIGYLEKEYKFFDTGNFDIPYSSLLAYAGIIIMSAFLYMDRAWYHKLLVGAVKQGIEIEKRWSRFYPEMRLTHSIGKESPNSFFKWKIHSKQKFWIFYGLLIGVLFGLGSVLILINNWA